MSDYDDDETEHFDDDELILCPDCDSNNITTLEDSEDKVWCVDCGLIFIPS